MLKTLTVGIDVGHDQHAVCLLDAEGRPQGKVFRIDNNRPGVQDLERRLALATQDYDQVLIGMEATGIYWWHLYRQLLRAGQDATPPRRVVVFNPKVTRGFRRAYIAMEKTDPQDAFLIAERLRFGHLPTAPPPDPRYFPLQRLTRYRFHLMHTVVRTKTHALMLLFLAASDYERLMPFNDPFGATSVAVLTAYHSLDELGQAPLDELAALLATHSRGRLSAPEALAQQLHDLASSSFSLDEEAVEPLHFLLSSTLAHIRFLTQALRSLDQRIAKELERFPNTLLSVPGIGPVYAAGLIAEVGDIRRFAGDDGLARYAGLWWPRHQSGNFDAEDRALSKAGNTYLRYYLCEAANSLRVHNESYRRFYDRKYKESPKHAHKRACVLTARKLVRLVHALLRSNQLYTGDGAVSPTKSPRQR
jgi:transposase